MLKPKVIDALNKQIKMEADASQFYLSAAAWCADKGFSGTAHFFYLQSDEEREHMMRIFKFLLETGVRPETPTVDQPPMDFPSFRSIFEQSLQHEQNVTRTIHGIVELCLAEKDHAAFNFLQWFVAEQIEEENLFRTILEKLDLIGEDGKSLYWLDKELGERKE